MSSRSQPVGEREAWGLWLNSMHARIPDSHWLNYTRESHALVTRYVESASSSMYGVQPQQSLQQSPTSAELRLPQEQRMHLTNHSQVHESMDT